MSYVHFTLEERKYLHQLLNEGYSMRRIADALGRSPSSVSREIARNRSKHKSHHKGENNYAYHHWRAQILYISRKRYRKHHQAIVSDSELEHYIVEKLQCFWSPEQIVNKWRIEHPEATISFATIYRYLHLKKLPNVSRKANLRRRGKRRQTRNASYNTIQPDHLVTQWPKAIVNRTRVGDWEGDTVYGGIGKGLLVTLVDRKTRYLVAGKLLKRASSLTRDTIKNLLQQHPVKSITFDNGSEFSEFRELEKDLDTTIYFAEPHKPWQRGTNENTNDILRFFFPKGFDFRKISQEDVNYVVDLINSRPRKCLGWKSPSEVFLGVALA